MSFELNNTDDTIDVRDMIERVEELESEVTDYGDGEFPEDSPAIQSRDELEALELLLGELAGNGGDEQWRGDWYPVTLIRDSYFETAMDELLEDCGDLPKDLPCYLSVTVDYKALQMDYTSVEIDGVTYWYR